MEVEDKVFARELMASLPALYRIASSILKHHADGEDAVAQAFEKAWKNRSKVWDGALRPWVTRILVNECRNIQRHRMRVFPTDVINESSQETDMSLKDAVEALPEKLRTIFLLKYMEGYSEKEIAKALGLPQSTIRGRLERARQKLKQELNA